MGSMAGGELASLSSVNDIHSLTPCEVTEVCSGGIVCLPWLMLVLVRACRSSCIPDSAGGVRDSRKGTNRESFMSSKMIRPASSKLDGWGGEG
jgi:hypothetical protein